MDIRVLIVITDALFFVGAVFCGFGWLHIFSFGLIGLFSILLYLWVRFERLPGKTILWVSLIVLGFWIGLYRPDGFHYPAVFDMDIDSAEKYSLYFNAAKLLSGFVALTWLIGKAVSNRHVPSALDYSLLIGCIGSVFTIAVGFVVLNPQIQIKTVELSFLFLGTRLLTTYIAEQVFLRLLIQRHILDVVKNKTIGISLSVAIPTFLYLIPYLAKSAELLLVYFCFSLAMSIGYALTKRLSIAVFIHASVSIFTFTFLEYPLRAS